MKFGIEFEFAYAHKFRDGRAIDALTDRASKLGWNVGDDGSIDDIEGLSNSWTTGTYEIRTKPYKSVEEFKKDFKSIFISPKIGINCIDGSKDLLIHFNYSTAMHIHFSNVISEKIVPLDDELDEYMSYKYDNWDYISYQEQEEPIEEEF